MKHYTERVEHPSLPSGRVYVRMLGKGRSASMSLQGVCPDGQEWRCDFPSRRKCLRWLLEAVPDGLLYASDGTVTVCGGTVANLAERAGVKLPRRAAEV